MPLSTTKSMLLIQKCRRLSSSRLLLCLQEELPPSPHEKILHQYSAGIRWNSAAPEQPDSNLRLHDSLSESLKTVSLGSNKGLAWYTCGPTTYAPAHIGHARTYVCLDIIRRILEHQAKISNDPQPLFVMNITDVDDKILTASQELGEPPLSLARRFEAEFWRDLDNLNCLRPQVITRVSEYVDSDIIPYITKLHRNGFAYETDDSLCFHIRAYEERLGSFTKYGKLAPSSAATDFFSLDNAERFKDGGSKAKKDPRDFVLWKKRKKGEKLYWNSPWGEGRPGWHIECSAMIEAVSLLFRDTHVFQAHAGGIDLKFPHHTNEIAQSEAYHSDSNMLQQRKEWIPHWVHTGHLHIDGLKMSKSLKNFVTIKTLLKDDHPTILTSPADDFRLWCLGFAGSYRSPATYSEERIQEARHRREKIVQFLLLSSESIERFRNTTPKKWTSTEQNLCFMVGKATERAIKGLVDDLNGEAFVREIDNMVDLGKTYLQKNPNCPTEPLEVCVTNIRELLSLVGFSNKTVRPELKNSTTNNEGISGGESKLIEEVVRFRSNVRSIALADLGGESAQAKREILSLCDDVREKTFPSIGLEVSDSNSNDNQWSSWKYCLPRTPNGSETKGEKKQLKRKGISLGEVAVEDFFKVGQYEGSFSQYDSDGIPLKKADGTAVSNRLLKKLLKKRKKHEERIK
mmetsp:Transcript_17450/g.25782  ORF Transcript_17450/g.25782 Transcript_17450/m.25782 type:complete len:686 (-) Transcript_17450:91-2148(-)